MLESEQNVVKIGLTVIYLLDMGIIQVASSLILPLEDNSNNNSNESIQFIFDAGRIGYSKTVLHFAGYLGCALKGMDLLKVLRIAWKKGQSS